MRTQFPAVQLDHELDVVGQLEVAEVLLGIEGAIANIMM
jgi:hypothetical protein